MNIAIQSSISEQNKFRGIGTYTSLMFEILQKGDIHNAYYHQDYNSSPKMQLDFLIIPNFSFFQNTIPFPKKAQKVIVTIHDVTPLIYKAHFPPGIKGNAVWQYQKLLIQKNVDWIVTDSNSSKHDVVKHISGIENKISVIYPVVDHAFKMLVNKPDSDKISHKYKLDKPFVLYVGDATWNKNLITLIQSAKKYGFELVVAGKVFKDVHIDLAHPWNDSLMRVKKESENVSNIHFLGYVSKEELICLYNNALVYIQPSVYEGFGLPIVEAMKCGTPVVVSNIEVFKEIAGDAAIYFNQEDTHDIYNKIKLFLTDASYRSTMSQKVLNRSKFFTHEKFLHAFQDLYKKLK